MIAASGAIKMHARNRIPVVKAVRPVRPPASTPDADSTKVVTVDVPVTAPTLWQLNRKPKPPSCLAYFPLYQPFLLVMQYQQCSDGIKHIYDTECDDE